MKIIRLPAWISILAGLLIAMSIGAASASAAVPSTNVFPIQGHTYTSCNNNFGDYRAGPPVHTHKGNDCLVPIGTPLVAVEAGRTTCEDAGLGGKGIQLYGNSGTRYYYAHLDRQLVCGGAVARGQLIGTSGNTGNAGDTPQLHFEIHPGNGAAVDPYPYLVQWSHSGPAPPPAEDYYWRGIDAAPAGNGYWLAGRDGGVFSFGSAKFAGSMGGKHLNQPVVDMTADPDRTGYWLLAKDGGVFGFGADFHGSAVGKAFDYYTGIASTRTGNGYWISGAHGGVYTFGDAHSYGSMAGKHLNGEIVDIEATPTGNGYWLLGKDGGVFGFGDAKYYGNAVGKAFDTYVDIEATKSGKGYWIAGAHGGVYSFGDAHFSGSMAGKGLNKPIQSMAADPDGRGYWLLGGDGGLFAFDAKFLGRGQAGL
jgi:hypothetical protein